MADVEEYGPYFKIGDLVKLRSGGPVMTIYMERADATADLGLYETVWFSGTEVRRDVFAEKELVPYEEPKPKP